MCNNNNKKLLNTDSERLHHCCHLPSKDVPHTTMGREMTPKIAPFPGTWGPPKHGYLGRPDSINHFHINGNTIVAWFSPAVNKWPPSDRHTHTHPFNGPLSRTTRVSWYQKGKTNLDFTEATDSERQWHQLGHMQVSTLLQTDNHANTSPLSFLQAGCPSCCPTNSVKALKAMTSIRAHIKKM